MVLDDILVEKKKGENSFLSLPHLLTSKVCSLRKSCFITSKVIFLPSEIGLKCTTSLLPLALHLIFLFTGCFAQLNTTTVSHPGFSFATYPDISTFDALQEQPYKLSPTLNLMYVHIFGNLASPVQGVSTYKVYELLNIHSSTSTN